VRRRCGRSSPDGIELTHGGTARWQTGSRSMKMPGVKALGKDRLQTTFETAPDGRTRVVLAGIIDESSALEDVFGRLTGDTIFNMKGVTRINSMGVHQWTTLVTQLSSRHRVEIEEISYPLVQNAIAVARMFGTGEVRSCMAPYVCTSCKSYQNVTVTRDEAAAAGEQPPVKLCAKCSAPMQFDDMKGYFSCLNPLPRK
jgi:hypothetical protein